MKKSIFTLISIFSFALIGIAQVPQAFKYQTVIRDATGQIIPEQSVTIGIDLLQDNSVVYSEIHNTTTNSFGLANLEIGRGTVGMGNFTEINWSNSTSVSVKLDAAGGTDLQSMGTSELLSVPYAITSGNFSSSGNLGIGTTPHPSIKLHIADGNTPTIRMEQDGSNGWTPLIWDVAANETNFFIRDVTNGSVLPFRIKSGSPQNTLFLNSSGNVTIGGEEDTHKLRVNGDIATTGMLVELSDQRTKKDITASPYGIKEVMLLSPKSYYYDTSKFEELDLSSEKQLGLLAQEVEAIVPEVIHQRHSEVKENGKSITLKGVSYIKLIPVLITAIQEQQAQLNAKNKALEDLSKEVVELKSQMTSIEGYLKNIEINNSEEIQIEKPYKSMGEVNAEKE